MFRTVKRIIDWCGEFKGKLYLGFVMTFFSHIFAAMPLALAAYTVGLLIEAQEKGTAFDTSWIWKSILIQIVLVFFRFLFDYFRACLQEPISYELTARDRLAVGDALKRVSLGYFHGFPECLPFQRHDPGEYLLRKAGRHGGGDDRSGKKSPLPRLYHGSAKGLRHGSRRGRR